MTPETFWSHASGDSCWMWDGAKCDKGYGRVNVSGVNRRAHRVAFELARGPIPAGMCVLHRCDQPACINPDHLFLGTIADNNRDMTSKGRHWHQRADKCAHGHPFDTENTRINAAGRRQCRACQADHSRRSKARRRAAR